MFAQVRLRLDANSALVREVWIKALTFNGRPLVPDVLSRWVQQSATTSVNGGNFDVAGLMRALLPFLNS